MNSGAQHVKQQIARVENPFAAPVAAEKETVGGAMMEQQAAASVQGMVVMAKQFPRDPNAAMQRILDACTRKTLASVATYAYPRGGQTVTGPSIRLAETVAQNWGNIDFGIVELSQEGGRSHMMAYAWDLETNVRQQKMFVVGHIRYSRNAGNQVLTDPRDIYEMTANQGARRLRACILGVIPGDVIETALRQCDTTLANSMGAPEDEVAKMIEAFAKFGVDEAAVRKRLGGKVLSAVTQAEVIRLRQIYVSLRDNMSSPGDWFDLSKGDNKDADAGAADKPAPHETKEALKKRLREGDDRPFVDPPEEKPQAAAQGEQEGSQEGDTTELFDDEGTEFDPTVHAFDKDTGEPIKNKDGTWRKQPGKKAESSPAGDLADPGPSDDELPL